MKRKELREEFLAALTGAGQGATMDFGDEIYGAARGGLDKLTGDDDESFRDAYKRRRDEARGYVKSTEEKYPIAYKTGDIAASMLTPGIGGARMGANLAKPILERAATSAIEGGIGGFGRSEAKTGKEALADTAESAASAAGTTIGFDQIMRRIGDVIDLKKMRTKKAAEKIAKEIDEGPELTPGKYSGSLGKTSKEMQAENNRRAFQEARIRPSKEMEFPDEIVTPRRDPDRTEAIKGNLSKIQRLIDELKGSDSKAVKNARDKQGNVVSIGNEFGGKPLKKAEAAVEKEYTPEDVWDRITARMDDWDDQTGNQPLRRLMKNVEKKGADEPYVGRDNHNVFALENPKNKQYYQPLPVPPSKIGDLKGVLGKGVLKGDSDPFAWMDAKYGITKALLERERDKNLKIYTRSDLIAHDDYIDKINPKLHEVNIVIGTPSDRISRVSEPGAPSIKRRIQAANKLAEQGIKVNFIYQTYDNPKLTDKFREVVQPPLLETMRSLRESGLAPGIKVIEQKTPIADVNVKNLKKIFGDEYGS